MPCDTPIRPNQTVAQRIKQRNESLARLEALIQANTVKIILDKRTGALMFSGWKRDDDRGGVTDACAYRVLTSRNSAVLRSAIDRAEVQQGVKVNAKAVAAGVHSHDGKSWGKEQP